MPYECPKHRGRALAPIEQAGEVCPTCGHPGPTTVVAYGPCVVCGQVIELPKPEPEPVVEAASAPEQVES